MDLLLEFRTDIPYQGFQEYVLRSEWDFTPLLDSLFPHKHRYASLENLSVTFKVADLAGVPAIEIRDSPVGAAVFPLRNLPSLKNFEVLTDLRFIVLTLIPEYFQRGTIRFPALRSLKFRGPRLKIRKYVGHVMKILKEQGKWDTFGELVVPQRHEKTSLGTSGRILRGEAIERWIRANNPNGNSTETLDALVLSQTTIGDSRSARRNYRRRRFLDLRVRD
ncbi:hypothetical protein SCHPADRAFT_686613 [Schizopora paradoxa]|uniref:Uncharacterized protein n=1 Tax=Schizopora paradoxa TaxID=27342 RepID=A0A0H2R443_9AGAM|nr:hypothetical protein SCHPADRAFT_686613 [Schizopora paradoxa]